MPELPILAELGEQLEAGFRRRETRRGRARLAAAAGAVALAAGLAIGFAIGGGAVHPPEASAASQLRAIAHAADAQAVRVPGPRQFLFMRARVRLLVPIRASLNTPLPRSALGEPAALVDYTYWVSYSAARTGRDRRPAALGQLPAPPRRAGGGSRSAGRASPRSCLPGRRSPRATGSASARTPSRSGGCRRCRRTRGRSSGACSPAPPNDVLAEVEQINQYPISAKLQGAIFRALALIPGIRAEGRVRALTGRVGMAFGVRSGHDVFELIIDPATGAVLGTRSIVGGRLFTEEAVVQRAITDRVGPPRS